MKEHISSERRRFRPNAIAAAALAAGAALGAEAGYAEVVDAAGRFHWRTSFATAVANGVDPEQWKIVSGIPAGMTVNQTGGNLVVTAGTNTNEELIIRSLVTFNASLRAQWMMQLSSRIVNEQFFVELVDVIGDGLAFTINSATSVTVSLSAAAAAKLTKGAGHVGQSINIGLIGGGAPAGCVPGRYAISAVAVVDGVTQLTFTVAGWPAAGAGTCSLFGWNFYRVEYSGTTATTAQFDAGRNGYATGNTAATINTTASPHLGIMAADDMVAALLDQTTASATGNQALPRASRVGNTPDPDVELHVQLRVLTGTVAPASSVTMTMGMVSVSDFVSQAVSIEATRPMSIQAPAPMLAFGAAADSSAAVGNPVPMAVEARTTQKTSATNAQTMRPVATVAGVPIARPYSIPELEWSYPAATGGITNTSDVVAKAAAGASIRNYVTGCQLQNVNATATEFVIKDGSTVLWRAYLPASMPAAVSVNFANPLKGTANTAVNIACITTGAQVYADVQGYAGP